MPKKQKIYSRLMRPAGETYFDIFSDLAKSRDWIGLYCGPLCVEVANGSFFSYKFVDREFVEAALTVLKPKGLLENSDRLIESYLVGLSNPLIHKLLLSGDWKFFNYDPMLSFQTASFISLKGFGSIEVDSASGRVNFHLNINNKTKISMVGVTNREAVNLFNNIENKIQAISLGLFGG